MADLQEFGELNRAEQEFAESCQAGEACALGSADLPEADADGRQIRGTLVRFFALGGSDEHPTHERGIDLSGAVISELLDMTGASRDYDLSLKNCRFSRRPVLKGSHVRSLDLSGSHCPGLDAEGLQTQGVVRLGTGFHATGQVRLVRSRIGADLDCAGGRFENPDSDALNADGTEVSGSVFLTGNLEEEEAEDGVRHVKFPFVCRGTARLISAGVGDSIQILDAIFTGGERKYALNLAHVRVKRQLTMKRFIEFDGRLNLSGASVYSMNDDPAEETAPQDLILNGFTFRHFSGKAPMTLAVRLAWLARQKPEAYGQDFWPQPYGQLASVYRESGHEADSRQILVMRDTLMGKVAVRLARSEGRPVQAFGIWLIDVFMRYMIGYGYRPQRGLIAMILFIGATAWFFDEAWDRGVMTPAAAPILISDGWQQAVSQHPDNPADAWSAKDGPGRDYETFHPIAYAFDLFVPLIDIGQQSTWGPSTTRGDWGVTGWWLRWVVEIVGWVVTALAAAAVTGLVRRN